MQQLAKESTLTPGRLCRVGAEVALTSMEDLRSQLEVFRDCQDFAQRSQLDAEAGAQRVAELRGALERRLAEGASQGGEQPTQGPEGLGQGRPEETCLKEENRQRAERHSQALLEGYQRLQKRVMEFQAETQGRKLGPHGFLYGPFSTAQGIAKQLAALLKVRTLLDCSAGRASTCGMPAGVVHQHLWRASTRGV